MSSKKCKCGMATFSYADDTRILRNMINQRETFAGTIVSKRVINSLKDMKKYCDLDIKDSTISKVEDIKETFESKKTGEKLTYNEMIQKSSLLAGLEEDVIPLLKRCAKKD